MKPRLSDETLNLIEEYFDLHPDDPSIIMWTKGNRKGQVLVGAGHNRVNIEGRKVYIRSIVSMFNRSEYYRIPLKARQEDLLEALDELRSRFDIRFANVPLADEEVPKQLRRAFKIIEDSIPKLGSDDVIESTRVMR